MVSFSTIRRIRSSSQGSRDSRLVTGQSRTAGEHLVASPQSLVTGASGADGFTLLELMIVMVIIGVLAAIAVPSYVRNIQRAKEAVLREDLHVLRNAIDSYTVDKQQAPQSLDDLVSSGYLHEIPNDPFTNHKDWITDTSGMLTSVDQTDAGGIDDVHSADQKTALDGTTYNTW